MSRLLLLLATLLCYGLHAPRGLAAGAVSAGRDAPVYTLPDNGYVSFEERRAGLLDALAALHRSHTYGGKFAYWYAQALLANGQTDDGLDAIEAALENREGTMFRLWAMADTYLRWQHLLPDATQEAFKKQLTGYAGYGSGSTENQSLMYAAARYLASEAWPQAPFRTAFRADDPTGRHFLLDKMDQYVHAGTVEFDSPSYHAFYIGVMRSLADLARDEDIRQRAALTAEWLILENAAEWLGGHWVSSSLRNKDGYTGQDDFRPSEYVLWLYFGAPFAPDYADKHALFAVQAAASAYRLPASIAVAATDRSKALVHRETDTRGNWHYYKTTYLHGGYGLYSVMEDYKVHFGYSQQYQRWAVQWRSDEDKSTLYVKHLHQTTGEEGTTGYEQVLQHEGTLLAVYAIPPNNPQPWVRLRTPSGFEAVLDESHAGDVFFHYGTVLVALRLSEAFAWDATSDVLDHRAGLLGAVIETAPPGAYTGDAVQQLRAFKQDVQQHALQFSVTANTPTLGYTNVHGDVLAITYEGDRTINDERVDLLAWPLLENPWMHQAMRGDRLVVETCAQRLTYDFAAWTRHVTEPSDNPACIPTGLPDADPADAPKSFVLEQNYPNPFNPTTTITYTLKEATHVSLTIYNLLNQKIATLVEGPRAPGVYTVRWDGRDGAGHAVASGVYLYRIEAGRHVAAKRMVLLR